MNAAEYDVPDDVTTVFMNNPFRGRILTQVLDRIQRTLSKAPRRLVVVYNNPQRDLAEVNWLRELWRTKTHDGHDIVIYESIG